MLPDGLFDRYKRYKRETADLVQWLVETAKAYENVAKLPTATKRQKKNAKKKAKAAARADGVTELPVAVEARANLSSEQQPATDPPSKHTIPLRDFVPLAQRIAKFTTSPAKAPAVISKTLRSIIASRKRCAKWYENQVANEPLFKGNNHTHMHFIRVLEQVFEILYPSGYSEAEKQSGNDNRTPLGGGIGDGKDNKKNISRKPGNIFETLDIEEPGASGPDVDVGSEDAGVDNTAMPTPIKHQTTDVYEVEPSEEDTVFAIYCLLDELDSIRKFLREVWSQYRSHDISLMNASVTTNTAIELVRRTGEEFVIAFPKCSTVEELLAVFFPIVSRKHGLGLDTNDVTHSDVYDYFFYQPSVALSWFCSFIKEGETHFLDVEYDYDLQADHSKFSNKEKARVDRSIVTDMLQEFLLLSLTDGFPMDDQLTDGLHEAFKTSKIEIWVVFGLQIFLDIHHILREDLYRGFQELRVTASRIKHIVHGYFHFLPELPSIKWPFEKDRLLYFVELIDLWISRDVLLLKRKAGYMARPGKPYHLLSQHPMMCGIMMFSLELKMQQAGMEYANNSFFIMTTVHLYNTLWQNGFLSIRWDDMDELIATIGIDHLFQGEVPATPEACIARYLLANGVAAHSFAANRRSTRMVQSKRGARKIDKVPQVLEILRNKYYPIEKVMVEAVLREVLIDRRQAARSTSSRARREMSDELTSVELLFVLQDRIAELEPRVLFNYHSLNRACWRLLCEIESTVHDEFYRWFDDLGKPATLDAMMPDLTNYFLSRLAMPQYATAARIDCREAGKVMRDFIERERTTKGSTGTGPQSESPIPDSSPTTS
ncbi:hypothetical protein MMC12_007802 [Toensbergia leucococca]|nr:hypothetical protein [Toensbergia leucococca]